MHQGLDFDLAQPMKAVADAGLFISVCNFLSRPTSGGQPVFDSAGQLDQVNAELAPVAGLQAIPCMLAVLRDFRPDVGATQRRPTETDTSNLRHVLLNGYYPAALQQYFAQVDGVIYETFAVEHDSQHTQTRLAVRLWQQ